MIIINPGSGKVKSGTVKQSEINIKAFIKDLDVKCEYKFIDVDTDGRHTYKIWNKKYKHTIDMPPGILDNVRYLAGGDQNMRDFPRLYVDGSSWVWCYALDMCFNDE